MFSAAPALLASLALFATVSAQSVLPEARQFVTCPCRASNRGFSENALTELKTTLVSLDKERRNLVEASFTDPSIDTAFIDKDLRRQAKEKWEHCVNNYSHEECVNADTSLRQRGSRPATTICYYNDKPDCSTVKEFASTDANIVSGNADVKFVPPPPPKPTEPEPQPTALPAEKPKPEPIAKPTPVAEAPKEPETNQPPTSEESEPVRTPPPGTKPASKPVSDSDSEPSKDVKGVSNPASVTSDNGGDGTSDSDGSASSAGESSGSSSESSADKEGASPAATGPEITLASTSEPKPRLPANEGCVAVEHLEGYHKQHRNDLVRRVLCANGFCATPNHALVVGGMWTSMKQLCSTGQWKCAESVKLVNNLDIFRNRRAQVGSVTITPYDVRFPRAVIWVAQFVDRLYSDYFYTFGMGLLTSAFVVARSRQTRT